MSVERYRSGHNGADSKSDGVVNTHAGSNPALSVFNGDISIMKCTSYCTAEQYDLDGLLTILHQNNFHPNKFDNVLHLKWEQANWVHEVFFFDYGCYVVWAQGSISGSVMSTLVSWVEAVAVKPLANPIEDTVFYVYADDTYVVEEEDTLFLEKDTLINLSMSHGLSQSVKLSAFEQAIMDTIRTSRYLTGELESRGKTSLSHHGLAQMIGHLFAARQSINLHTDILDTPEFFWRRPKYEPYYHMVASFMDLAPRIEILNQRVGVIQELYQMLSDELRHEHSSRLELIIIALIMFEVVLGLCTYFS